jgi:GT2 family glycosyltransferase
MAQMAVVIVNRNTREHLRACLTTVPPGTEICVVDNASTDGSADMARAEFPDILVLADGTNPGYGAGANKGIQATQAEYVLVLNSDTRLSPDTLEVLSRYLDQSPGVGLVGARLLNPDGSEQTSCFPFPGTLQWLLENDPVGSLLGHIPILRRKLYRFAPPERPTAVPWVLGAVLAIRREAFDRAGGFDEAVFLYYEEVDLCARLRAEGWEVHIVPDAEVVHFGAASTSQSRASMAAEHFKSTLWFYRRYYAGPRLAFWLLLMRSKMGFQLLRDGLASALAVDTMRRARLREDAGGWWRALRQP